jgi:hypothetical protein
MTSSPWSGEPSGSGRSGRSRSQPGRLIEIVTVVLLAVATVGSAWSAYQVSRWNGVETDEARASAVLRIESSREFGLATQVAAYDAATVAQYAAAVASENEALQDFLRATLVRPGFVPMFDSWEAQISAGQTPTNLLADEEYLDGLFASSDALDAEAGEATARAEEAGANGDDYIRLTLFFASALFFAGITASFSTRFSKILLLLGSAVILGAAGVLLAGFPVA